MAVAQKKYHSTGKLNINSNECIKLSRNTSWSEISSTDKIKVRSKYQPVRIKQLSDPKSIYQMARKPEPERLGVISKDKKVELSPSSNVKEKSQQKNLMKMNLHDKNIQSNSKSNKKEMSYNLNKCNRKIRRNLNLNFVSLKKQVEKNTGTALPEVQENNKSICSNSKNYRYRKSFILPPNFIKNKYLKKQCSKVIPSSITCMKNDTITNLDVSEALKNLHIKNPNVQICSSIQNTEVYVNDDITDFSRKDYLYVDKNTIVSLKSTLEDMLKVFQDNALKIDLLLKHINKVFHVNTDSIEEQVHIVDSNDEMIKKTIKLNLEEKITEDNNIDTVSSISKINNNNVKMKMEESVELNEEEKENIFKNLEFQSDHTNIDHTKSLQLSPQVLQITTPNYTKVNESALQDYLNLKASFNCLETPTSKKFQPRMQKNQNVIPNTPNYKSYLSTKIFTELQNLYAE